MIKIIIDNPILIYVDDDHILLKVLRIQLEEFFDVITFHDAMEAYEHIKNLNHDNFTLLTDYKMPQMNGTDLIEKVHAIKPNSKKILLTAFYDKLDAARVEHICAAVMDKNMLKNLNELVGKIKTIIAS